MKMKELLNKYKLELIGLGVGAVAGWSIGCSSGTCAITSSPLNSSLYMAVMGFLVFGLFKKETKKENHG